MYSWRRSSMMRPLPAGPHARHKALGHDDPRLRLVILLALGIGLLNRFVSGWQAPLWLDENFSAVIASQKDAAHLLQWMLHELSGPVFYGPLWLWSQIFGDSNIALRTPSFLASIAAPLLALRWGYPDQRMRMIWAALLALSMHGYGYATEARPYALLILIGTAQTILFSRLVRAPSTERAAGWIAVCGLGILTNYYMAIFATVQGLLYLASAPRAALRTWPAAFALIPVLAWMAYHLPFVLSYASSGGTWYNYFDPAQLPRVPGFLLGVWPFSDALALGMGVALLFGVVELLRTRAPIDPQKRADIYAIGASVLTVTLIVGWAMVSRSFTPRYLLPLTPAILLGASWFLVWLDRRCSLWCSIIVIALIAGMGAAFAVQRLQDPEQDRRYAMNFEQPSDWIAAQGATRQLIFFWDNPTGDISSPVQMAEVAGYFLHRAGHRPVVAIPALPRDADPNVRLPALATGPGSAILWAYDTDVPFTRGKRFPARIAKLDPRWHCHNFGKQNVTVMACVRL
jgi:hypothetical protein